MKVIDLYNLVANDEELPEKIKLKDFEEIYTLREDCTGYKWYGEEKEHKEFSDIIHQNLEYVLKQEVEIIEEPQPTKEEKKKFTKEDFIKERMGIDKITRKEFDEMYEVKECNCGMPYCKGFIAVDKEEQQKHKIPRNIFLNKTDGDYYIDAYSYEKVPLKREKLSPEEVSIINKINEIIDYLSKED